MSLEGNLKDFPLPEILQLLGLQKKTGILVVRSEIDTGMVFFFKGDVIYAVVQSVPDRIGDILLRMEKVTMDHLQQAFMSSGTEGLGLQLGKTLMTLQIITPKDFEEVVRQQIEEVITYLFRWGSGRFKFDPTFLPAEEDVVARIAFDALIMEGVRKMDEVSRSEERYPRNAVLHVPPGVSRELAKIYLQLTDFTVFREIDGKMTIGELLEKLGMSEYDVYKSLTDLLAEGLVAYKSGGPAPAPKPEGGAELEQALIAPDGPAV